MKEQSDLIKTLSENIKKARETMHITQVKLAESSGVSVSHIVDIEECKTWVSEKTFSAIAKALNMEAHELLMPDNSGKNLLNKFLTDAVLELHYFLTQSEREANKKKQAEGIAAARARGVHLGRPTVKLPDNFSALKKQWEQGRLSIKDFAAKTGLKESTLYRRLRKNDLANVNK